MFTRMVDLKCKAGKKQNPWGQEKPMKVVHCRDVGVVCDFVARGETEQEVLLSVR
jgi:hypothetical protein